MIYILIAVLISSHGSATTLEVEFHNQKACLDALAVLTTKINANGSNMRSGGVFMCTPKG